VVALVAGLTLLAVGCGRFTAWPAWQTLLLPLIPSSVRFAVIGDSGTGGGPQYDVARRMMAFHERFPFGFVLMLGDNIYGREDPSDYELKFERPYRALVDAGVEFYAVLGNHDNASQRFYAPFHMGGQRYYTFTQGGVRFFALDSNYMDPEQLAWIEAQLRGTHEPWKICFFHHPLYSAGRRHGSEKDLRALLEPLFVRYGVNAVFSGHEHLYERMRARHGITYFTSGAAAKLSRSDLAVGGPDRAQLAVGYDQDREFMLVEIAGDTLSYQAISRTGRTVDSGTIQRAAAADRERAGAPDRERGGAAARVSSSRARRVTRSARIVPLGELGERPVLLEDGRDPLHHLAVADDHAHLAPGVELELAQALAADEGAIAVAHDHPDVQALPRILLRLQPGASLGELAENTDVDSGLRALLQQRDDRAVADLRVVDQEVLARLFDEGRQSLARVHGAHHEGVESRNVRLARRVRLEELQGFRDQLAVLGDDPEAAAAVDVEPRVVEAEDVERAAIDHQELVVVAQQVVARARDDHSRREQPELELP
jgi:hypothetical protein